MKTFLVRIAVLAALSVTLGACFSDYQEVGEDRLASVDAGMPKDSVLAIMGDGPLTAEFADTLRVTNGFRRSSYFVNGNSYEVLYYREEPGNVTETVEQDRETPILLQDGKVLGWGWKFYVDAMKKYNLPSPITAKPAAPATVAPTDTTARPDSAPKA